MSKTILAVWHTGSRGKSSSLREAAKYLLSAFPNHRFPPGAPSSIPATGDFRLVVNVRGKIVAFETQGDPNTDLGGRLQEIVSLYAPDVILCSTRTKGETVEAVEAIERNHSYESIWTSTYQVDIAQQNAANALKGRHIVELLQGLSII
jgi:hypothetical protein